MSSGVFSLLSAVSRLRLTPAIVAATIAPIREYGAVGCERLVLWFGEIDRKDAVVTEVYVPPQTPISGEEGLGYFVDASTLHAVNRHLSSTGLRLLAQVHSHPTHAFHSETDDAYAIVTQEGGFSLVVPFFGRGEPDVATWAAYRLRHGAWISEHAGRVLTVVGEE